MSFTQSYQSKKLESPPRVLTHVTKLNQKTHCSQQAVSLLSISVVTLPSRDRDFKKVNSNCMKLNTAKDNTLKKKPHSKEVLIQPIYYYPYLKSSDRAAWINIFTLNYQKQSTTSSTNY